MENVQVAEDQSKRDHVRSDVVRAARDAMEVGSLTDVCLLIADVQRADFKREKNNIAPTWGYVFVSVANFARIGSLNRWSVEGDGWTAEIVAFHRATYAKALAKPTHNWLREQFPGIDFAAKIAKQKGTIPLIIAEPRRFSFDRVEVRPC